ncbi:TonB-dependent receptor plug domain-containing protein [Methylomonas sp. CM2]|uniref:TonB-dependent receptor plug domain-containing protein n=1 Tax=Methylomonas sp. CM2 TaxID=3417647 RepID=UPI003CE82170
MIDNAEFTARAAQNITQAVAYTPGLLTGMFGPSTRDDYFNLRGFDAPQYLDGTRLAGANYANLRIDPYSLERIEVLRGPASVLYGQNPPGGLINMVSKRPTAQPFHELQMLGGSFGRVQGALDFSGPLDDQGQFLYRLTALAAAATARSISARTTAISSRPVLLGSQTPTPR